MGILSLICYFPIIGIILILFVPKSKNELVKYIATATVVVDFFLSLLLLRGFDLQGVIDSPQFKESLTWIPSLGIRYEFGIDGISLLLILLTTVLGIIAIVSSYSAISTRVKEYYIFLLLLQVTMLGVFMSLDFFLFYIFWEVMLVPMYFLIGIWGGGRKLYSAIKFFLYTLFGSLFMLLGILTLYFYVQTPSDKLFLGLFPGLENPIAGTFGVLAFHNIATSLPLQLQIWVFAAMFLGFAIKVPMFPFHTWLPDAHTDAPTAGSVILAGVLLKMGTYGFIRFALPILPKGALYWMDWMVVICLVGIVYGALVCMVQKDMKRLIAYSSVSHMGFVMLGIFVFTPTGMKGGLLQMFNHGITTGALFLLVGIIYERRHTKEIREFGGLSSVMPIYAAIFAYMALASLGLPGLCGFVGEFMILMGTYEVSFAWAAVAALGVILAAAYMLWLFQRVFFGKITREENKNLQDLNLREILYLVPLIILALWIGLYPAPILKYLDAPANHLINQIQGDYSANREDLAELIKGAEESAPHHENADYEASGEGHHE